MVFKINISDKGKTIKIETESESLVKNKIGDIIKGESFSPDFEGYELEITGTSDASGFPGIKGQVGTTRRKILLTSKDKGMNTKRPKGLRIKKSIRGEEISEETSQINMSVKKQGKKKFESLVPKKKGEAAAEPEKPAEEKKEEPKEEKTEQKPEAEPEQDSEPKESAQDKEPSQDTIAPKSANPEEEPTQDTIAPESADPDKEPETK